MVTAIRTAPMVAMLAAIYYPPSTAQAAKIVIEAEDADEVVRHFVVKSTKDKRVPSGKYLECLEGALGPKKQDLRGHATYTFSVADTGEYYLWLRRWWGAGCEGDSVWVQVDGNPPATGPRTGPVCDDKGRYRRQLGLRVGEDGTCNRWTWSRASDQRKAYPFRLTPGKHELTIWVRSGNVRIDQILLTTDKNFVPVRVEDSVSPQRSPASADAGPPVCE